MSISRKVTAGSKKINFTSGKILNVCFDKNINLKIVNLDIKENYHQFDG